MSLVKCKKCKKEISTTAKFCPNCGESNEKKFCRECGKEMAITDTSCKSCGYIANEQTFYNRPQPVSNKGEKYEIGLIALICSFLVPIAGLVLGIMAMNANKGLKNDARTMGLVATIVSSIQMALVLIIFVIYFFIFFMTFALY